ncbi:glycoside hydrolase family 19 protein [Metapseudomonas furukawaii]
MFLLDLYDVIRDEYRRWRDGPPAPTSSRPQTTPSTASPLLPGSTPVQAPRPSSDLPAVKNWSHPFGDTSSVFQQLTTLAKAQAGYFPLGRNGLWHGGVHFDSGTAGTAGPEGQSYVRCLADGEVIAYRIPEQTPKTRYFPAPGITVDAPFASGFVLVRHRLEAPKIAGITDTPPSLTVYSLYMHLADWASYLADTGKARPGFWPEASQRRVMMTNTDPSPVHPGELGLNLRHAPAQGKIIGFLPRGATVTVSGEGTYRKVEGIRGPVKLQNPDGTLKGYVSFRALLDLGGGLYRVDTNSGALRVRPTPDTSREKIFELPRGTQITISGEGEFRKLESVVQYVHFASLEGERVPECGKVVVLDRAFPIKAGRLIGHLGPYQESHEEAPQEKLHLEVFACDNVERFFNECRAWADRMPEQDKTWLKLEKGTKVVTHQAGYSRTTPPNPAHPHLVSGARLLIPRSLLDGLSADKKIAVPATDATRARNWYRLDDLLIDADGSNIPQGWVCDEVGVTPWVNPWSWDGYEVIYNSDPPRNALAHFLRGLGNYFDDKELEQWMPYADASDKGPVRQRLLEIIDADGDGTITAREVQEALKVPAHAQSISQLVIHYESEWFYQQRKWDSLDKVLGHSGSTPILNWVAEKERIKELSWWEDVAGAGVLPASGSISCIHPLTIGISLATTRRITVEFLEKVTGKTGDWFTGVGGSASFVKEFPENYPNIYMFDKYEFVEILNELLHRYGIETPYQQAHFISQCFHECANFETTVEFASGERYNPGAHPDAIKNENTDPGDGPKYKGKGLIQLTWKKNYRLYSCFKGGDFVSNPNLIAEDMNLAIDVSCWFWRKNGAVHKKYDAKGDINILIENEPRNVGLITLAVNGGDNGLAERRRIFEKIAMAWGLR